MRVQQGVSPLFYAVGGSVWRRKSQQKKTLLSTISIIAKPWPGPRSLQARMILFGEIEQNEHARPLVKAPAAQDTE